MRRVDAGALTEPELPVAANAAPFSGLAETIFCVTRVAGPSLYVVEPIRSRAVGSDVGRVWRGMLGRVGVVSFLAVAWLLVSSSGCIVANSVCASNCSRKFDECATRCEMDPRTQKSCRERCDSEENACSSACPSVTDGC